MLKDFNLTKGQVKNLQLAFLTKAKFAIFGTFLKTT
jgi:hypothetical protein